MKNKIDKKFYKCILFFIFILHADVMSRSFEGNIISSQEDHYPIWVDINTSEDSGSITGSYFYKKVGRELLLSGTSDGKNIVLIERDKKSNKVTGIFNLQLSANKLCGTWNNGNSKDTLAVLLFNTNPGFKKFAKIPKPSELFLLENIFDGRITFADEINHFGDIKKKDTDDEGVSIYTLFSRCNILSVELHWTNYWYSAHYGTTHHTFDLSTRKEIKLWDNFTPEFEIYILSELQKILTDKRRQYDDSVWLDELFRLENISDVNKLFTVNSIPNRSELFLKNDSLYFWLEDFCEQNYDTGNRGMSFDCMFGIPLNSMQKYLKEDSILNQLFTKH